MKTLKKHDKVKQNLPKKTKEKKKIIDILNKKWLINGSTTIILILIIFLIYFGVNFLLDKVILPEYDFTENKLYSLSDETKTKMKNLSKEVTITLINYGDNQDYIGLVEKYVALSDKIKMERIDDLASRSDIMQKYSLSATDKIILINSDGKEKELSEYDLSTFDYSTYETVDISEEAITNAIIDITTENKPKIYIMNNHTQYKADYLKTIKSALEDDASEVETLDLLVAGSVPEDCDCLIITTLKEDITESEKDYILDYISRGGEMLLLCGPNLLGVQLNNFNQVLNQYGITIEDGVIFEGSTSNMLYGYPDFIVEEVLNNSITESLNMNLNVCFADAAAISIDENKLEELGVEYETLITTTDKAFKRTNLNINSSNRTSEDSKEGEYTIGILATKTIDENKTSKVVLYSNELFAMDMSISLNGYTYSIANLYNNADIVINSISYLNEREDIITIRKYNDTVTYSVTQGQHNIIMAIIFITPVVIIALGIVIWICRRRKK